MQQPQPGQRWMSTSEPTLGLGVVVEADARRVLIRYDAAGERRAYALESAPLVRVRFEPGDDVRDRDGVDFVVEQVRDADGLLYYAGGGRERVETELCDSLAFVRPEKRLLAGLADSPQAFDERIQALEWRSRIAQSPVRGFAGARIDLIDHQLAIVDEVCSRLHPRVMLADEVGLGKTIEACLILHRLQLSGRARRILILVPEPLIHQWFIELLRRFNLLFALFDEGRCASIEANDPEVNPFFDSQLVLAATGLLAADPRRAAQAADAGFELMIVDEAHHLEWSPEVVSPAYEAVELLASEVPSVLLLTATPQQLGPEGHFARLRLLDPDRYGDLDAFRRESGSYGVLADAVEALQQGRVPKGIEPWLEQSPAAAAMFKRLQGGEQEVSGELARALIDFFGTGRVMFRNTRERLDGFPERRPILHPLAEGESPYRWLAGLLQELPAHQKVLLITSSPEAAITVQQKLLAEIHVESGLFHEDLGLVERDRQAAWFADPEGARILICSEIGSEGRNFQFARHLVLFGLPRDPELLEQRIGRLDRIGQTGTVHIHVPYGVGSRSELQARWLHEGLDAFTRPLKGASTLAAELLPELDLVEPGDIAAFDRLLDRSRQLKEQIQQELACGHDRLLELSAPPASKIQELKRMMESSDSDRRFESFVVRLFDVLGLDVSDLFPRSYHFHRGVRQSEAFAEVPEEGVSVTFERPVALAREDMTFMTPDHPMFLGALDHLLDGERGNASFAVWKRGQGKSVWLECAFVVEVIAPGFLHVDRFLPPTVVRVLVDHQGRVVDEPLPTAMLKPGDSRALVMQEVFRTTLFPRMLGVARAEVDKVMRRVVEDAGEVAAGACGRDVQRLRELALRNPQVQAAEIGSLEAHAADLLAAIAGARVRLDALRLIWSS